MTAVPKGAAVPISRIASRRHAAHGVMMRFGPLACASALICLVFSAPASAAPIDAARIREHVRILSSDVFQGRGPTQAGEEKTIEYLARMFQAAGLEPGGPNKSWFQDVPLIRYDRVGTPRLSVSVAGATMPLEAGRNVTASSRIVGETRLDKAPLVFVGYGIDASAIGWTGFSGADLKGKVAVFLANDPDFEATQPGPFGGRTLVYAGRFGAKVEAAIQAGAINGGGSAPGKLLSDIDIALAETPT